MLKRNFIPLWVWYTVAFEFHANSSRNGTQFNSRFKAALPAWSEYALCGSISKNLHVQPAWQPTWHVHSSQIMTLMWEHQQSTILLKKLQNVSTVEILPPWLPSDPASPLHNITSAYIHTLKVGLLFTQDTVWITLLYTTVNKHHSHLIVYTIYTLMTEIEHRDIRFYLFRPYFIFY